MIEEEEEEEVGRRRIIYGRATNLSSTDDPLGVETVFSGKGGGWPSSSLELRGVR